MRTRFISPLTFGIIPQKKDEYDFNEKNNKLYIKQTRNQLRGFNTDLVVNDLAAEQNIAIFTMLENE